MNKLNNSQDLEKMKKSLLDERDPDRTTVTICGGTGCKASGCQMIIQELSLKR
jgi:NADH-quinone oxidoreductase subunit F